MNAEHKDDEEFLMQEFDFSRAVRGRFADRFTPESRDAFLRDNAYGTVAALTTYASEQIRELEEALFTLLVLARGEPVQQRWELQALVDMACDAKLMSGALIRRLQTLVGELEWMQQPRDEPYTGPGSFNPTLDRLDAIYREARALKEKVDSLVQRHLARSGMSEQEIERKTEETARLWQAA